MNQPIKGCENCQAPRRKLWTYGRKPSLNDVGVYNWLTLLKCSACEQLWASSPYEPYAAFEFLVAWPYARLQWEAVHELSADLPHPQQSTGQILREWHEAMIREQWKTLPPDEQQFVTAWRDRSYRHYNCIDRGPEFPTRQFVERSDEIAQFLRTANDSPA